MAEAYPCGAEVVPGTCVSQAFLESVGQPTATVSREIDGGETPVFKEFFHVFDPPVSLSVADRVVRGSGSAGKGMRRTVCAALTVSGGDVS